MPEVTMLVSSKDKNQGILAAEFMLLMTMLFVEFCYMYIIFTLSNISIFPFMTSENPLERENYL